MDVLHITPTRNLKSIMRSKIFRSKPILSQYDDIMQYYYPTEYDAEKGLVFGFPETIKHRDRIIKDFIYWKTWGEDRNKILCSLKDEEFINLQNEGLKIFSHLKLKRCHYSILLLDIDHEPLFDYYLHEQSAAGEFFKDMDVRYEHNDKPLVLMNYDVPKCRIKRVFGTAESFINKRNKIDVTIRV